MAPKTILILEDEQIPALDLKETLVSFGYEITGIAPTGEKAVRMVDERVPDLILMDIQLAGKMSGIEAAEIILSRQSVPIIYITAYADPDLVEQAKKTKPYGYLIKPYDDRAIRTEIEIALYKAGLDQNFRKECEILTEWVRQRTEDLARANDALKKSEARYRLLFERSGEGIFIFDAEGKTPGRIVEVNPAGAAIHRYSAGELAGKNMADLTAPEKRGSGASAFRTILDGTWIGGESDHVRKDGSVFPIEYNAGLLEIDGHRYVFSVMRDISERKRTQDAILRARDEWEYTFNAVPDLIMIIDDKFRIIRANRAMADSLRTTPESLTGRFCYEVVHQAGEPPDICPHRQLLADGRGHTLDIREDRLGGDFQLSVTPVRDKDGTVTGSIHVLHDISRRKRDENALRAVSTELQVIIDNAPGMIWYKDTKNNFVRVNPDGARVFGMPVDRIVGKNSADLFPGLADRYYQDDLEVIRSKRPKLGITEQMTTARGDTLWVQSDKVPILDEKGEVTGILVFVVDITDRKIAQDALALANKKLGLMASITRHDIINQLMALNAYIELCREEATDPAIITHLKTMAKVSASIERHITFTRDYQTIGDQAPEWQDVGACVYRATASLPMKNIRVTTDLHEIKVLADPLFEKIFYNLIDNALRYGGDRMTQIRISSLETPQGLTIVIEDDGAMIAPEDRAHLFTKGFGKNTGLGLFLSREILGITGMEIRETGTSGKGARFEISVPKGAYRLRA
ncbi:MAG: aerobic respiration control sensor protein ArcB [Methanoregula sp. PtaB.Bin085]|nr:MAG: aerobic respiration control sensor protein ArcB [Methanoregula sp. PtaB.Bin085]